MSQPADATSRTVEFMASDGAELTGDLTVPSTPRAGAIVCHPHPQYGGNRHDQIVTTVAGALVANGVAALRFDFRTRFDHGGGERLDALAAVDVLAEVTPDLPIIAVGYSFGAMIAMTVDDPRVVAQVLIAPPLVADSASHDVAVPTLVLVPAHDQFSPPEQTGPIVEAWRTSSEVPVDVEVIASADHFLAGHAVDVATRATRWIDALLR